MGRIVIRGKKVFEFLQRVVSKDLSKVRECMMSGPVLLLNDDGGIKDDVMLYNFSEDTWLAVVNAANIEKDINWLLSLRERLGFTKEDVDFEDVTEKSVLIAIQGPKALEIIEEFGVSDAKSLKILEFIKDAHVLGNKALLLSRSGWTGEEIRSYGFEIWADPKLGGELLLKARELGARPAGLIARDSLRLEMGYLLVGNDISEDINPIEARYWMALTFKKKGYVGYEAVKEIYENGIERIRVGLKLGKGIRAIPRHGDSIVVDGKVVGVITSGAYSPYIKRSIALGYINVRYAYIGYKVFIRIRGKDYEAKIVEPPFI